MARPRTAKHFWSKLRIVAPILLPPPLTPSKRGRVGGKKNTPGCMSTLLPRRLGKLLLDARLPSSRRKVIFVCVPLKPLQLHTISRPLHSVCTSRTYVCRLHDLLLILYTRSDPLILSYVQNTYLVPGVLLLRCAPHENMPRCALRSDCVSYYLHPSLEEGKGSKETPRLPSHSPVRASAHTQVSYHSTRRIFVFADLQLTMVGDLAHVCRCMYPSLSPYPPPLLPPIYIGWVGVGWPRHCKISRSQRELNNQGTVFFLFFFAVASRWLSSEIICAR